MSTITLRLEWIIDETLTDATSVTLANAGATAGVIRDDTGATVVASGVAMTHVGTGLYEYTFTAPAAGLRYTYYPTVVYNTVTYGPYTLHQVDASGSPDITDLCNFAIGLVGGAANATQPFIEDYTDDPDDQDSPVTLRFCQLYFPRCRDKLQGAHEWPEVIRFANLGDALDDEIRLLVPGWLYSYEKPACLALRGLVGNDVNEVTGEWNEYPFLEVGDQVACNVDNDEDDPDYLFRYCAQVTDVSKWSEALRQSVGHLLAIYLARTVGVPTDAQVTLVRWFEDAYAKARADCQKRIFVPSRLAQRGDSVELAPGILDFNFPQPC
jgi:hypothetical protein